MARVNAQERVRRSVERVEARARAAAPIPASWVGFSAAAVVGWVGLALGLGAVWWAWDHGRSVLTIVVIGLCAGVVFTAGRWVAHPDVERGGWFAALSALAAGGVWAMGSHTGAVALLVVLAGVSVGWLAYVGWARRRARSMAWAAQLLAEASGDGRCPDLIVTPARTTTGLPARWNLPPELAKRAAAAVVDEEDAEDEDRPAFFGSGRPGGFDAAAVVGGALGCRVVVRVHRGIAVIDVAPPEVSAEVRQLQAQISRYLGGRVVAFKRAADKKKTFESMEFTWPGKFSDRARSKAYQDRLVGTLQSMIGASVDADWSIPKRRAVLTPLPPLATELPRPARDDEHPMQIAFGERRGGKPCIFDLNGTLPHIGIGGGTGAGKTVLARTLLLGLPRTGGQAVEVWPIDPKMIGFAGLDQIPGVHAPATTPEEFVDYLQAVHTEMMRRYELLKARPAVRKELAPIVLLIDEGEEMADILNDWWASGEGKEDWMARRGKKGTGSTHPAMKLYLGSILRLGRAARTHVIVASQQFSTSWMATSSRSQLGIRIAVSNLESSTSEMLFGSRVATSGLDGNTPGRAWVSIGRGAVPVEAQIYWTPEIEEGLDDDDRAILHSLGVRLPDDPADLVIPGELVATSEPPATNNRDPDATQVDVPDDMAALLAMATEIVVTTQHASTAMVCRKLRVGHELAGTILQALTANGVITPGENGSWMVLTPPTPSTEIPDHPDEEEDEDDNDSASMDGELVPVLDLPDGARILIEHGGQTTVATVQNIAPDETDLDYVEVTYITDAEAVGSLFVTDDESVTVLTDHTLGLT